MQLQRKIRKEFVSRRQLYDIVTSTNMRIKSLGIANIKSFADSGDIQLSPSLNVFVGQNNAGKTTILKALSAIQNQNAFVASDRRRGLDQGEVRLVVSDLTEPNLLGLAREFFLRKNDEAHLIFRVASNGNNLLVVHPQNPANPQALSIIPATEPRNFIYPYSAKRKVLQFEQSVNIGTATTVADNLAYLVSKVDRIRDPVHEAYPQFDNVCREILGFPVSTFPATNGKQAGILVADHDPITIEAMGEGTAHLLGLITTLCTARHKLFLIEEIENDIHPQALKALLGLIVEKSRENQFVLSTHSNIVTKYIGAEFGSKVFDVSMRIVGGLPTSTCNSVGNTPNDRRTVLEDLGYALEDFDLWKGWLFLEESSAERLIRDYFVPWFFPSLAGKLRTIAATGTSTVEPKFEDFNRLFLFTHLESVYVNRAWVVLDGDTSGLQIVKQLRAKYAARWEESHFRTFSKEAFEHFYPPSFSDRVAAALAVLDKKQRQEAKKLLLEDVLSWIVADEEQAKSEFEVSAADVLTVLEDIKDQLKL